MFVAVMLRRDRPGDAGEDVPLVRRDIIVLGVRAPLLLGIRWVVSKLVSDDERRRITIAVFVVRFFALSSRSRFSRSIRSAAEIDGARLDALTLRRLVSRVLAISGFGASGVGPAGIVRSVGAVLGASMWPTI